MILNSHVKRANTHTMTNAETVPEANTVLGDTETLIISTGYV